MESLLLERRADQRWLVGVVCAGAFIANLDATIVNIALPTLSRELRISPSIASWAILAYFLFETGLMLPLGKVADVRGIRAVYLAGFGVFLLGSVLCGTSRGIGALIAFRAVQGVGGAMLFTVMMAFIPMYLPPERRVQATGLVTTAAALGVALGPPLGGWITALAGWRWIFYVNVPFCLAAAWIARRRIPSAWPRAADARVDLAGAALSFAALLLFLLGISMGRELGWTSPAIVGALGGSALLVAAFVRRERRVAYPLVQLALLRDRRLTCGLLALGASLMTVGGVLFVFPFYLEEYRALDTHRAGMIMALLSCGQLVGPATGRLAGRYGVARVCLLGLQLGLVAFLMFLGLDPVSSVAFIVLALGVFGLSQGLGKAPNAALVIERAPPGARGAVSGLLSVCRSLSVALGVLFFETVFSEAIPHRVSLERTHLAAGIAHVRELAPGFRSAFLLGAAVSLLAVALLLASRQEPEPR